MVKIFIQFINKNIFGIFSEACKKFFLRSVNEEYRKYKCIKDKKCIITRTTRTQCQYCRYAKCIDVGMKLSGKLLLLAILLFIFQIEGNPNPKIEDIFKQIPCAVCQNPSSGIHFGATTCEVIIQNIFLQEKTIFFLKS
jgi:hypothetical protein